MRRILVAKTPDDLLRAIYAAEGWTRREGEVRSRRCAELYTLTTDHRHGRYVATPK